MAITLSDAVANVKTFFYKVYVRETGTAIASGDYDTAANWATFLALFTDIGQCENENVKLTQTPSGNIVINEGKTRNTRYDCKFEAQYVQGAVADLTAIRTDLEDSNVDILLVDEAGQKAIYVHKQELSYELVETSGDVFRATLSCEQILPKGSKMDVTVSIPQS